MQHRESSERGGRPSVLVLGIGNVLMGDEGVGVHVVRRLEKLRFPDHVTCLDGGTGGFVLLGALHEADRILLVDATVDGRATGTVRRLRPRYSKDYPRTLTAHDIGLKDLLDAFHLTGTEPDVTLVAVSIDPEQEVGAPLSAGLAAEVPRIAQQVLDELDLGLSLSEDG